MRPVRATALYLVRYFKAFALSGRQVTAQNKNPGRCPGLRASAPSGRAAYMGFCPFRACCCGLLDHQGVLLIWAAWTSGRCCYGLLGVLLIWAFGPLGVAVPCKFRRIFRAVWLKLPSMPFCTVEITQHALKGQKLLAQGSALGIMSVSNAPCKGKSFKIHLIKMGKSPTICKGFALTGR